MVSAVVLMSAYNGEAYLREQIESILSQRGDFQLTLHIRDDGSSDGTRGILKTYEDRENIIITYGENIGITASYFELMRTAGKYDYYALSDQDDVWLPDKLAAAIAALEKAAGNDCPLLYGCRSFLVDENLIKTGKMTQSNLRGLTVRNTMIQNILLGHNQVFNRALLTELTKEKADFSRIYAHDMWNTCLAAVTGKIIFENEPHTLYRQHSRNELGFGSGAGSLKWLAVRLKRALHGEGRLIARQFACFVESHGREMRPEDLEECRRFLTSSESFVKRVRYALRTKFYRQRKNEDFLFRVLYVLGGYRKG